MSETEVKNKQQSKRIFSPLMFGILCLFFSLIIGTTAWIVFGSGNKPENREKIASIFGKKANSDAAKETTPTYQKTQQTEQSSPPKLALENGLNLVSISAGESSIGGEGTEIPVTSQSVDAFTIGETEVTNEQYAQFVNETNSPNPGYWKSNDLPEDLKNTPVVNISHKEAGSFCTWLGKKFNAEGRLPTEFEWEYAARGKEQQKYSWGNEPNPAVVEHNQPLGKLKPVKFYPENRSPFGVYDMAGSVWEWTDSAPSAEEIKNNKNRAVLAGKNLRILKGSSVNEKLDSIFPGRREIVPTDVRDMSIGFRCVVVIK